MPATSCPGGRATPRWKALGPVLLSWSATALPAFAKIQDREGPDLFNLSLRELLEVRVASSASVLPTDPRRVPGAVTRISREDIARSGARSLDELLEMFVPGFQTVDKALGNGPQMGIRGIIGDRNTRVLLVVNGVLMNERTINGALAERHLSMLGDIASIDVTRGPGSAINGPGAIAGVIHITTLSSGSFEGGEVVARQGLVERFSGLEALQSLKFANDSGLFLYYGVDRYEGSGQGDSPLYFSRSFTTADGQQVVAGAPVPFGIQNNHRSYHGQLRHKVHADYTLGDFHAWMRYTRGGLAANPALPNYTGPPNGPAGGAEALEGRDIGFRYQAFSLHGTYRQPLGDSLELRYTFGLQRHDFDHDRIEFANQRFSERRMSGGLTGVWRFHGEDLASLGVETVGEVFGRTGWGDDQPAFINPGMASLPGGTPRWGTQSRSVVGEYQSNWNSPWNLVLGARGDKHSYTGWLWSPHGAVLYSVTPVDGIKILVGKSVRRADDSDLRRAYQAVGNDRNLPESILAYEVRYEHVPAKGWQFNASGFHYAYDLISFLSPPFREEPIGRVVIRGVDVETGYVDGPFQIRFSHAFSKQVTMHLTNPVQVPNNLISSAPYGYGNDLANIHTHETKFRADFRRGDWSLNGSLRYLWGMPGSEAAAAYNASVQKNPFAPWTDGDATAFRRSAFLGGGIRYQFTPKLSLALHAYDVLGLVHRDFNKRNTYQATTQYRSEAPALAITLKATW